MICVLSFADFFYFKMFILIKDGTGALIMYTSHSSFMYLKSRLTADYGKIGTQHLT